jgi:hypothetical protein
LSSIRFAIAAIETANGLPHAKKAGLDEIAARYSEWEIIGPPETYWPVDGSFTPFRDKRTDDSSLLMHSGERTRSPGRVVSALVGSIVVPELHRRDRRDRAAGRAAVAVDDVVAG